MAAPPPGPGAAPPPGTIAPPYPPAYPPPYPPPPQKQGSTLLIVIVVLVVVLVVVPAIIAAYVFLVLLPSFPSPTTKPTVTFGPVSEAQGNVTFAVEAMSQITIAGFFEANLRVDGVPGSAESLDTSGASITVGSVTYRVYWEDIGNTAYLSVGDGFRVTGDGAALPTGTYVFYLVWLFDGDVIAQVTWQIQSTARTMGMQITRSTDGTNWTLLITSVPSGLSTATTTLTILAANGATALTATAFSALSYATHGALYQGDGDGVVEVGESLLIGTVTYPQGHVVRIADPIGILFQGTLL